MKTLSKAVETKITRVRSRFLAYAVPVTSAGDVENMLGKLRREHHGARHIPYAYRLRSGEERASDDGEPASSAGRPILRLIEEEDLRDVLVAVVRYFGGIKLGVGRLSRTYRAAARDAIAAGGVRDLVPEARVVVTTDVGGIGAVLASAGRLGGRILGQRFEDRVELEIGLPEAKARLLQAAVAPWGEVKEIGSG